MCVCDSVKSGLPKGRAVSHLHVHIDLAKKTQDGQLPGRQTFGRVIGMPFQDVLRSAASGSPLSGHWVTPALGEPSGESTELQGSAGAGAGERVQKETSWRRVFASFLRILKQLAICMKPQMCKNRTFAPVVCRPPGSLQGLDALPRC